MPTSVIPESHRDLLDKPVLAHVATIGPQGEPQNNPVWFIWDDDRFWMSIGPTGQKARNLERDPRIAISMADPDNPIHYLELRGHVTDIRTVSSSEPLIVALVRKAHKESGFTGAVLAAEKGKVIAAVAVGEVDGKPLEPTSLFEIASCTKPFTAVAVMKLYGGPACVVDFGTATTFNAVTKDGEYLGGAITAGINLAAEALYTRAAKLPRIDLQVPPSVIGRNTVHAMQSGLLFGYVSMGINKGKPPAIKHILQR